jgi:lipopolysaccharide transport system permease protein
VVGSFWRHRRLALQLARRDVLARYRGSSLGLAWALASPLLMLAVFTFVFSVVFESRWDVALESRAEFALLLFAGLLVFWLFSDCANRAPGLLLENASYVKRVVFPLEILPWVALLGALFHTAVSAAVLLAAYALWIGLPPWTVAWVPLLFLPLALMVLGLSWFLASVGIYLRDVKQIVPVAVLMVMFLSPVFYPLSAVPPAFRPAILANPLTWIIESVRGALFFGRAPGLGAVALATAAGWLVAWAGLLWFAKTRKGFADVV